MEFGKDTKELNEQLEKADNKEKLEELLKDIQNTSTFGDWFYHTLEDKGMSIPDVEKNTDISHSYIYAIQNNTKKPSRETVIKIGLAMGLEKEELDRGLKIAGFKELYVKNEDDALILYGFGKKLDIWEIDELLREHGSQMHLVD